MLIISDEQRKHLELDGPPLPFIDPDQGSGYMLMPVKFTRSPSGGIQARIPGIRAVGEGDQATEALAALAVLIQDVLELL